MNELFWYEIEGAIVCSPDSCRDFKRLAALPDGVERAFFLFSRPRESSRAAFAVSHPGQLLAAHEDYRWLDANSLPDVAAGADLERLIGERRLTAVNIAYPRWRELLRPLPLRRKLRLHLLAVGDVGGMLLSGLKLLGGGLLESIGIHDLKRETTARWEYELNQVAWPWDYGALPEIECLEPEQLFACDAFVFCATAGVPPLHAGTGDVRLAQFEKNAAIIGAYARQAAADGFSGLFAVVSDPVDQLCQAAYVAAEGGLFPEQIEGYGLGVMNSRAAYFARRDPRFAAFLSEGRAYGPHGEGLVIADSVAHYQDGLSRELTRLALTANLRAREMGFKPYIAPALSSAALPLLLTIGGEWHYSATRLGAVWMGAKNRRLPAGLEVEALPLPVALEKRLAETYSRLTDFAPGGDTHD